MKILIKNILLFSAFFCGYAVTAQFNTLTRATVTSNKLQKVVNENVDKSKPAGKDKLKRLSTKDRVKLLQREIDSLKKATSLNHNNIQEVEIDYLKILKDSIISILSNTANLNNSSSKIVRSEKKEFWLKHIDNKFSKRFYLPLGNPIQVSSKFGNRHHPIYKTAKMHNGTDLKALYENVITVLDGFVLQSGWDSKGGGYYMKIQHSNAFVSSYLHLSERYFQAGDYVKAGSIIAKSGNSGNSTGPHLHFAIQENGKYIDPIKFLNDLFKAHHLIATYYEK